ncbi:hypothetical protein ABVT39_015536, partial [Epinephelus coioides]
MESTCVKIAIVSDTFVTYTSEAADSSALILIYAAVSMGRVRAGILPLLTVLRSVISALARL